MEKKLTNSNKPANADETPKVSKKAMPHGTIKYKNGTVVAINMPPQGSNVNDPTAPGMSGHSHMAPNTGRLVASSYEHENGETLSEQPHRVMSFKSFLENS